MKAEDRQLKFGKLAFAMLPFGLYIPWAAYFVSITIIQ